MRTKTLIQLLLLLAVLIGAAYYLNRPAPSAPVIEGAVAGKPVFANLDVNAVAALEFVSVNTTLQVARAESGWTIPSLYAYPAQFSRIAGFLRKVADLEVGQVMRHGEASLREYGLDPEQAGDPDHVAVTLSGANGAPLARFTLGALKHRGQSDAMGMGFPQGRFMRVENGPVLLIDELFTDVVMSPVEWLDRELAAINQEDVVSVSVKTAENAYTLRRDAEKTFVLDEQTDLAVNADNARRLLQNLQNIRFDTLVDPAKPDEEVGLHNADTVIVRLGTGLEYTFTIGQGTDGGAQRALRVSAAAANDNEERKAEAAALNAKHGNWRYLLPSFQATQWTPTRESLIVTPPAEAAPESEASNLDMMP